MTTNPSLAAFDAVDAAITQRHSVRAFLPQPLGTGTVMEILDVAARSPSGHNTQPWQVHLLTGEALRRLSEAIFAVFDVPERAHEFVPEFDAYPSEWISPYLDRRRQVGKDMYTLLRVPRGDRAGMRQQARRNYAFFGAPVGLLFTLRRVMVPGSVLDLGIFLQSVMVAAQARGIATCPQAAFANFHKVIKPSLGLADDEVLICGMAMGWRDASAAVNHLDVGRQSASDFTRVHSL